MLHSFSAMSLLSLGGVALGCRNGRPAQNDPHRISIRAEDFSVFKRDDFEHALLRQSALPSE